MGARLTGGAASTIALATALALRPTATAASTAQGYEPAAPAPALPEGPAAAMATRPKGVGPTEEPAIIITGSRIPRPNLTAVSPVSVVNAQEVKLEGSTYTEELLNQLPQVTPDQGAFISNGATGTSTVVLRGLGPGRTLVLINGRRLGPGDPRSPTPDINIVPNSIIQRVEVLTGGASSVYGSDAVAGVVNFILDSRIEGLRVDGQASVFQHDNRNSYITPLLQQAGLGYPAGNTVDAERRDINAAFGHSFLDGRAHVTVYAGYRDAQALTQDSRDYSACSIVTNRFDINVTQCGGSPVAFPGNFLTNFDFYQIGPDRTFVPGRSFYNFAPLNYYQRPDRRYTAGGFAELEISKALRPYLDVMYLNDRSVAQIAPSGNFGNTQDINCDSPLLSDQQRNIICSEGNFVGEFPVFDDDGNLLEVLGSPTPFTDPVTGKTYFRGQLLVLRRAADLGGRQDDLRHKDFRITGGTKGDLVRGVTYDASYLSQRADMSDAHLNDYSITRLTRALDVISDPATGKPVCRSVLTGEDPNCVPWDIFALGAVTPQANAYLSVPSFIHGFTKEQVANANATFDFSAWNVRSPWADEFPQINAGAEWRKDVLVFEPDELSLSGDLAGNGFSSPPISGSINVKELFAESRIPLINSHLIDELAFEGGYRHSWYSNAGSGFSTNAYKIGLDLTAVRGLRLRASYQRAVRAPNLIELFYPPNPAGFDDDPCAGPTPEATAQQCANTGVTQSQYGHILKLPLSFGGYNAIVGGNPSLEPETATAKSAGIVLEPRFLPGFTATADWWDIDLQGAIEDIGADTIMSTCIETADPLFCNRIHRDSQGSLWLSAQGYVDDTRANIGALHTRGVDFAATFTHRIGRLGSLNADFLGTYVSKWIIDNGGLSTPYDCAGLYGFQCGIPTPSWRHKARLTWDSRSGVSLSLQWRRIGKMTLADASGRVPDLGFSEHDRILPTYDYLDFSALVHVGKRYEFRVGVNNLFDTQPPLFTTDLGACWGGCNGNTYPQWYDPLGRYMFAGVTANF